MLVLLLEAEGAEERDRRPSCTASWSGLYDLLPLKVHALFSSWYPISCTFTRQPKVMSPITQVGGRHCSCCGRSWRLIMHHVRRCGSYV